MTTEQFQQLTAVAARQHGLVTGAQARRTGLPSLDDLAGHGLLLELEWDVHQLTSSSLPPRFAYPYAAWLALEPERFAFERGNDAVLSHGSAARLQGLGAVSATTTTFIAPRPPAVRPRAVEVRETYLASADVITVGPLAVTTPHRTILDLVLAHGDHGEIRGALTDAVRRDLVDLARLYAELVPLAEHHEFPAEGPEFAGYFLPDLNPAGLSPRNLRALTTVVLADRVTAAAGLLTQALAAAPGGDRADEAVIRELSAEIVGRTERV